MTAPAAPRLEWTGNTADGTPNFYVWIPNIPGSGIAVANDVLRIQYQSTGGAWGSPTTYLTHTLSSADLLASVVTDTASQPSNGSYDFRARLERGVDSSDWATATATVTIAADVTAPTAVTFSPVDGSSGASPLADLTVVFDEDVQFAPTVAIGIYKTSDDSLVEAFDEGDIDTRISISGDTLAINPASQLSDSTGYYVLIDATSIEDLAENGYAGITSKTTWNFTTGLVASKEYLNGDFTETGSATHTVSSVNLGGATNGRRIVVLTSQYSGLRPTAVSIGGKALSEDYGATPNSFGLSAWSAVFNSGDPSGPQTCSITYSAGAGYSARWAFIWKLENLGVGYAGTGTSTGGAGTGTGLNVNAGDIVLATVLEQANAAADFSLSDIDPSPDDHYVGYQSNNANSPSGASAGWLITDGATPFTVKANHGFSEELIVSYR